MIDIRSMIKGKRKEIFEIRRDLHRIPETAFKEVKTAEYIIKRLNKERIKIETGIAGTGIVGLIETGRPGPTLMIRSDIDALPILEATDLPFVSEHKGLMHACGHDGHMAMVLMTVTLLNLVKDNLKGNIKFVFQPAEEGPGGAKLMIDQGVMDNPKVDYSVGCHLWPSLPEGTIGIKPGPLMAAMGRFDIRVIGTGGHGAMPHQTTDALEIGTQVVGALQRLISRKINPLNPAVLTVGSFHSGSAFNVIPDEAEMSGTTRTFDISLWESWGTIIEQVVNGICESMNARYEFNYTKGYPPLINDETMTEIVCKCSELTVGAANVVDPEPSMGGEDMAFYFNKSKGCFFFLGTGREDSASLHNDKFNFNEEVLLSGIENYCRIAFELLENY